MRYDIRLRIGYDYALPVRSARHLLRVAPRNDRGQAVHALSLDIVPKTDETIEELCFFGNRTQHLLMNQPHGALSVEMRARVEVRRVEPDLSHGPALAPLADLARQCRAENGQSPIFQLPASRMVSPLPEAGVFVSESLSGLSPGLGVLAVARRIAGEFAYQPGFSSLSTTPAQTLSSRRGVCQDFAHLMIAGLRQVGIPAAYVSGFLRTDPPPGQPRIEGADAMHAWIEAWLGPELGWVGFDPTNGCLAGEGHVAVAFGRDYADVAPVAGVVTTTGAQAARHAVDVVPEYEPPAPWQASLAAA
ncbi:transglutaminase family protein [Aureimonas altamirensis]|uniref:transglutaminase family protein n=1 Tax=Aureimonas altamirensis TaxID=370622 RepID=UPI002037250F|nr:transglutaminase family protein [Aureimonas altamirensis]MCM2504163.1 transglutaminase family protein [Aureimonas altamirensis]